MSLSFIDIFSLFFVIKSFFKKGGHLIILSELRAENGLPTNQIYYRLFNAYLLLMIVTHFFFKKRWPTPNVP